MLTIKDISASQDLDRTAMSDVRGGGDVYSTNLQSNQGAAVGGLVGIVDNDNVLFSQNNAIDNKFKLEQTDITNVAAGLGNIAGVHA